MVKAIQFIIHGVLAVLLTGVVYETDKPAYLLYNMEGDRITYEELIKRSAASDLILFGEQHNSAIAHWLQLEMVRDLSADNHVKTLVGMEMFEADQQLLIDEYFSGLISRNSFENEARLWSNYQTDYKPIVEFARENGLQLIATNIPRRYASAVYSDGLDLLDSLSSVAREWMMPLPVEVDTTLKSYQNIYESAQGHGGKNLVYSQAVKDATMAHIIMDHLDEKSRMIHLNGSYHSNDFEGIGWYVGQQSPEVRMLTINTITAEDIDQVDPDRLTAADYTLVVPSTMTTTH